MSTIIEAMEPLQRLTKDLAKAAVTLSPHEARFLVDNYYMMQDNRIRAAHQARTLEKGEEPHAVIDWFQAQSAMLENQIKRALDKWTDGDEVGAWAKSITGIGPVIAAGLLANIDITAEGRETAGHLWSYAGLNPDVTWNKGEKRPYNASLKTLCAFKLGESFVKVQSNDNDIYGRVFVFRKEQEHRFNDQFKFRPLAEKKALLVRKDTDAYKFYKEGKLPPAHIHARARRYAVKLFLAHYHMVAYFHHFKKMPPFPYAFSHLKGHVDFVEPPHASLIDQMAKALKKYKIELRKQGQL